MNIKALGLLLSMTLAAPMAHAEDVVGDIKEGNCTLFGNLAAAVMTNHQHRVPLEKSLAVATNRKDNVYKDIYKKLVLDAYAAPRWATVENQEKAIADYRDKVALNCLKSDDTSTNLEPEEGD